MVTPASCRCRYVAVQGWAPWIMRIWVPLLITLIAAACIAIEFRVGVQYYAELAGADWAQATLTQCQSDNGGASGVGTGTDTSGSAVAPPAVGR